MAWYRAGTVSATSGQTTIIGAGTNFALGARVGDALIGPDGLLYEIANIASPTVLSVLPAYRGESVIEGAYSIGPLQGYVKESADRLRAVTDGLEDITEDVEAARLSAVAAGESASTASGSASQAALDRAAAEQAAGEAQAALHDTEAHAQEAQEAAQQGIGYRDSTAELAEQAEGSAESARLSAEAAAQSEHNVSNKANSGANSDITSLSGLTTPLSEEQGGTGSATGLKVMVGASEVAPGEKGLVPAPGAGDHENVLYGDGSWRAGGGGRFFGELVMLPNRQSSPNGVIKADGQWITNATAQYPTVVADLQSATPSVPVVTPANWLADPLNRASWAYDAANDQIRVPDWNGVQAGSIGPLMFRGDGTLGFAPGKVRRDQFQGHDRTIFGGVYNAGTLAGPTNAGATWSRAKSSEWTYITNGYLSDGANGTPRVGSETFPTHGVGVWGVVLFGAVSNPGAADAAALATSYANLSSRLTTLEASFGFAYLYPNGGTEAAPANVAVNSRYEMANPFAGHEVIVVAEIQVGGKWGDAGWLYSANGYGVKGAQLDLNTIVVQTGSYRLGYTSSSSGDPFGQTNTGLTSAPCRVKVWRVKS